MKKINRILSVLLCAVMIISSIGVSALAAETPDSGKIGENISWELSPEGELTIKGKGKMTSWEWNGSPFFNNKKITKVKVSEGIENIGSGAFSWCAGIKEVILPSGLINIENYAFCYCTALEKINIPMTVREIGSFALSFCSSIPEICIPDSTLNIRNGAFKGAAGLKNIYLGTGLKSVQDEAFAECSGIEKIYIRDAELFGAVAFGEKQGQESFFAVKPDVVKTGDADLDGNITSADARIILRYSVGLEAAVSAPFSDMDADCALTAGDARLILRASVGLYPETEDQWCRKFADAVSYEDLEFRIKWLVNDIGIRSWWDSTQNTAASYLYNTLITYGYEEGSTLEKQYFKKNGVGGGLTGINLIATVPTAKENPDIILVLAHYDTVRGTGAAVDNGSGTATLLQLAKLYKAQNKDFGAEIRFLFTAGEEQGYFGAYAYSYDLTEEELARHKTVFNIDMSGKPNDAYSPGEKYYLAVCTETRSTDGYTAPAASENHISRAVDYSVELIGCPSADGYYSPVRAGAHDIVVFRKLGLPAVTLSWRIINNTAGNVNDYKLDSPKIIHKPEDNIKNFDMDSLYDATRIASASIAKILYSYK